MAPRLRSTGVALGRTLTLALAAAVTAGPLVVQSGEELFTTVCTACYTTTSERLVGVIRVKGLYDHCRSVSAVPPSVLS